MHLAEGAFGQAVLAFRQAAEIAEKWAARDPSFDELRFLAGRRRIGAAMALRQDGRPEAGVREARAGVQLLEQAREQDPADRRVLADLGWGLGELSQLLVLQREHDEALEVLLRARGLANRAAEQDRDNAFVQRQAVILDDQIGIVCQQMGEDEQRRPAEREQAFGRAIEAYRSCLDGLERLRVRNFGTEADARIPAHLSQLIEDCVRARAALSESSD